MAFTPPTTPEEAYELSPFGFGPFPPPGQSVDVAPPHPDGGGYGGVGFLAYGGWATPGGSPYGLGAFGSSWFGRPLLNIDGGYGGSPYGGVPDGDGAYGGVELVPPYISAAISITSYEVEVYFSEEMDPANPALVDPLAYILTAVLGAAPIAQITGVHVEKVGTINWAGNDFIAGVLSVVLTHTGATLGGLYTVAGVGMTDLSGNVLSITPEWFRSRGQAPQFVAALPAPDPGNEVLVTFDQDMLPAISEPGPGPGISDAASYEFTPTTSYPVDLVPLSATQTTARIVTLTVQGMTSLEYTLLVGPSFAYRYTPVGGLVDAVRVDTGTGTAVVSGSNLVVGRLKNLTWQLEWQDLSGTIVPLASTLRMDFGYDFSAAVYAPAITTFPFPEVAEVTFQDGTPGNGVLVRFTFQYGVGNAEQIRIRSGSYDTTLAYAWATGGAHVVSFVRNMKSGMGVFLVDDFPLEATAIANLDGVPDTQAGTRFILLNGAWDLAGVRVQSLQTTSSTTVFSNVWNFVHGGLALFMGSSVLTRDTLYTQRGPLVKGWGDATPATDQDVTVEVNGSAVVIAEVNPYIGEIQVAVPIPLLPFGHPQAAVKVDYQWQKTPIMEMAGLNVPGLVLNKYDCPRRGHHDPAAHGETVEVKPPPMAGSFPKGAVDTQRFPYGVVLGPMTRPAPLYIGHRYMGFERAYSALTNSPTTLTLNQVPGRAAVPGFDRTVQGVSVAYEGLVKPGDAAPAWALTGTDFGGIDHSAELGLDLGTYTVIDALTGAFDAADTRATVYRRGVDLTYPASITLVGRFQTATVLFDAQHPQGTGATATVPTPDGVFTGVGFGIHDNQRLYLCGVLSVNGLEHVGLLLDPKRPHEAASWSIGPHTTMTASSQTRGSLLTALVPVGFLAGSRFQVLTGDQIGVYTATSVVAQTNGTTTVDFTPALPVPWDIWGHKYPEVTFETSTSGDPSTYRLDIDTEQQVAELRISGAMRGIVATIDGNVPLLPPPAQTALLLPMDSNGQVFWGSLSRQAANRATWSFIRYALIPDRVFLLGHAIVVNTEMTALPELDSAAQWFPKQTFGDATIDGANKLLLKSGMNHPTIDLTYGYCRVEPFFIPDALFDFRAKMRLESGVLGAGDVELRLDDTQRLVRVVPITYLEGFGGTTDRRLVTQPSTSMTGFTLPGTFGWAAQATLVPAAIVEGTQLVVSQTATARGGWAKNLDLSTLLATDTDGRLFEARLAVTAYTANAAGDTGIRFGCQMPLMVGYALVQVELRAGAIPGVRLRTAAGLPIQSYDFDWTDAEPHTYRVLADQVAATVSLVIDDVVQVPVAALAGASGGTNAVQTFFGCYGVNGASVADATITCTVEWHHFHCHVLPPLAAHRTFGIWLGGDATDINAYEIPRTDMSTAPNSWAAGPVIEDMDWRQEVELRVYHDPGWGVTFYRPDQAPPPYYTGDFITDSVEPSAGWINVEYQKLPRSPGTALGLVGFGNFDPAGLPQSRWDWVRYRMFRHPSVDRIAPEHMVLNQYNVITSGERTLDKDLEMVAVQSLDWYRVTLLPTHLFASTIYKIIDGQTLYTGNDWTFDAASQMVSLLPDSAGVPRFFGTKTSGATGSYTAGSATFTDSAANFSSMVAGDYLHILFGRAAGDYEILEVSSATTLLLATAPTTSATGASWVVTGAHTALTVYFVPGSPVTNTYLLNQPLLDGVTILNEGTPPVPKSQIANSQIVVIQGSQLNTPADVDDPNPPLNPVDPYRRMEHTDVAGTYYEDLDFYEVADEGETGLIASICETGPGTGFSGFSATEGENVYSKTGTGDPLNGGGHMAGHFATGTLVGKAVGAEVWDFSGTAFWEEEKVPKNPDWTQKGGMTGGILFASGGSFVNPVAVGSGGAIIPGALVAGGGTLGPGSAVLWPSFPARGPVGGDQGRIYKRTDWLIRWGPTSPAGAGLDETLTWSGIDEDPPSYPASWTANPNGTPHVLGAAFGQVQSAGDYSRYGPWGGLPGLTPDHDRGAFRVGTPVEGSTVGIYDPGLGVWVDFTARAVPILPTDFALAPTPHISLAAAINAYTFPTGIVASPGLTLSGQFMTLIGTTNPVITPSNLVYIRTGATVAFQLGDCLRLSATLGLLSFGGGLVQGSLLAGGTQNGTQIEVPDLTRGMVCAGGAALPLGAQLNLTFHAATS